MKVLDISGTIILPIMRSSSFENYIISLSFCWYLLPAISKFQWHQD